MTTADVWVVYGAMCAAVLVPWALIEAGDAIADRIRGWRRGR